LPTKIVFGLSDTLRSHGLVLLGGIVVVVIAVVAYFNSAAGKAAWSRVQLRLIGFGKIYTMVAICRFCRVLGTMLANGIPILQSLKISKDATGNTVLADSIEEAAESVRAGESLARPLT
jgi:general secretion pathway protein F/type IV pilus assembly protein PilC